MQINRKIIGVVLGMALSTGLGYALETEADLVALLFDKAGVDAEFESDPSAIEDLSLAKEPFKDLYLFMVQNVTLQPRDAAIAETAKKTLYSEEDVATMVLDGNLSPIFTKYEDEELQNQQNLIGQEYFWIQEIYNSEFEFQLQNHSLAYEAIAQEIFMDGEPGNSANIDLLFDLDVIHFLMFGEFFSPIDHSSDEEVVLSSEVDVLSAEEDALQILLAQTEEVAPEEFSPLMCTEDSSLRDSIEAFEETVVADEDEPPSPLLGDEEEDDEVHGIRVTASDDELVDGQSLDDFLAGLDGSPGKWERPLPCDDTFCVTINLVTAADEPDEESSETVYEPEENCIACHTAFILQRMEETLSKSLVPGKVSQNWFEDGTCKEAGLEVALDLNVYVVKKPIQLDPNDDLDESAQKNVDDLNANLKTLGVLHDPEDGSNPGNSSEEIDFQNLVYFRCQNRQDDCIEDAIERREVRERAVALAFEEFILKSRGENSIALYEQMAAELYSFSKYMEQFQISLEDTYITQNAPLTSLTNKSYCE